MSSGSDVSGKGFFYEVKVLSELMILKSTLVASFTAVLGSIMAGVHDILVLSLLFLVFFMLMAGCFALDSLKDVEEDIINNPDRPIPSGRIERSQASRLAATLLTFSFVLVVALYFVRPVLDVLVLEAFALVAAVIYSVPVALKRVPLVSNVILASLNTLFPILAGWMLLKPLDSAPFFVIASLFFLALGDGEDLGDVEGDRSVGTRTLPVMMGLKRAAIVFSSIILFSALIGVFDFLLNHRFYWVIALPQQFAIFFLTLRHTNKAGKQDFYRVHGWCKVLSVLTGLTLIIGYMLFG